MASPMIRRSLPSGERVYMADQQARHPTPIRRLSLMNEEESDDENQNRLLATPMGMATPVGMTILSPDDLSASVSHLDTSSANREVGAEIENTMGSYSARRGRRGSQSFASIQHTPLPPSSALKIPGSHSKALTNSSRSRRSVPRYWGENIEPPTEREVQNLHARFNQMQLGLGDIEHERLRLVEKSKELEEEKEELEKQLELRDTEIHALVKRCATQEEKIREFSSVRLQNRELATNLEIMVAKLENMKSSSTNLHELKRQLSESENARQELKKRLEWVEKEHDAIASTLKECLGNIRKLTTEKQQLEEDRIRERKRSEMEMEQQRLSMVQISHDLQQKQQQIEEMELVIQQQHLKRDTASTMSSTRDSVVGGQISITRYDDHLDEQTRGSFDSEILDARLRKTVQRYEKQIADMKLQVESHVEQIMEEEEQKRQEIANEYDRQIEWMRKELLKTGSNEGRLFELQSKLAEQGVKMTREQESNHQVREAAERYEKTISDLKAILEQKNQELREKNEANSELQAQIASHEMDLQSQAKNMKVYEEQIDDLEKLLHEQDQELESSKEACEKITKNYEENVQEIEKRLNEQKQELQSSKDSCARLQKINEEKEALASSQEIRIAQLQTQISQQEIEMQTKASRIATLESQAREHAQVKNLLAENETNATLFQTQMKQKEAELQFAKTEYENEIAWFENELNDQKHVQMRLEAENRVLTDKKNQLGDRMHEIVSTYENKMSDLHQAKNKAETRLKEFVANHERQVKALQDSNNEMEARMKGLASSHENELKAFHDAKKEAETRLNELLAHHESKAKDLQDAKDELEAKMKELVSANEQTVTRLQTLLDQKETELQQIKEESTNLQAELKKYKKKLEEQGELLSSREEMNEKLKGMKKEGEEMVSQLMATHGVTIASLKSSIERKDVELESKDQIIAEYKDKVTELHDELVKSKKTANALQAKMEEEKAEIEKEMKKMHILHCEKMEEVTSKTDRLRNKLVEMKDKLDEREERISNLEDEFSEQMQELMNKQVAIDKVEDRRQQLEAQIQNLQHFEDEHAAMVHYIEIMESNCAELTAENGILNVEKESLIEDKRQLQQKLEGLEDRVTTLRDKHVAREEEVKEDLHREVVKLQHDLEAARQLLAAKTEEITKVRMEAKQTLESMQVSLEKARDEIVELEDQLGWEKSLQTQPTDASEEIESLTQALEAESRRCEDLQDRLDSLLDGEIVKKLEDLEKQRLSLQEDLKAAHEEIALQEQELERRDQHIGSLVSEIEKAKSYCAELEEKRTSLENHMLSTEEDLIEKLNNSTNDLAEKEAALSAMRASIADKNLQIESLMSEMKQNKDEQVELADKLSDAESKIVSHEMELRKQTEKISMMQKKLQEGSDSTKGLISDLGKQIHQMKTDIALKDDEIRELRMVDLKDAEEEVSELKASLESKRLLEQELQSKRSLVIELQKNINELKMNHTRLLSRERDLMDECDRLHNSETEAKEYLAKVQSELQFVLRERENFESDLRSNKLSQECELRKLEKEVGETYEKLSEVLSLNEGLEQRLAVKENELREERQELESKCREIAKLQQEFLEKETSWKQQLDEERRNGEATKQNIVNMKRQTDDASSYNKHVSENEKDIDGLKDKVKRQEAHMRKRMHREKLSSRAAIVPAPKPTPAPRTKNNAQSLATSHLARRRQSGIPSMPSSTDGDVSTPSTRRNQRASLLPIARFMSPGFRNDLD